jgi:hypothetical protein
VLDRFSFSDRYQILIRDMSFRNQRQILPVEEGAAFSAAGAALLALVLRSGHVLFGVSPGYDWLWVFEEPLSLLVRLRISFWNWEMFIPMIPCAGPGPQPQRLQP